MTIQTNVTVHLTLKKSRTIEKALGKLEDRFTNEGGWWSVPCGIIDHLETELELEEELFESLSHDDLVEFLGLEPEWVLEAYEV